MSFSILVKVGIENAGPLVKHLEENRTASSEIPGWDILQDTWEMTGRILVCGSRARSRPLSPCWEADLAGFSAIHQKQRGSWWECQPAWTDDAHIVNAQSPRFKVSL